ncbi:hypothetical protein JCM15765_33270 [Paradesulfitobacterium aromaticivorans]
MSGAAMAALLLYGLGLLLFYFIVKVAVRNGVREATEKTQQSIEEIRDLVQASAKAQYEKPRE